MATDPVKDPTYQSAENAIKAGLAQHNVGVHNHEDIKFNVGVTAGGAPRSISGIEEKFDEKTGSNREVLSFTFDLTATGVDPKTIKDGEMRLAVTETLQNILSGDKFNYDVKNEAGESKTVKLADAFDWHGKDAEKIPVKFDVDSDGGKAYLTLNLPANVGHWNVIDALAGIDTIKAKSTQREVVGEQTAKLVEGNNAAADAPKLTPVVGEGVATGNLAKERAAAANEPQARGVA